MLCCCRHAVQDDDSTKRDDVCGFCGIVGRCRTDLSTKGRKKKTQGILKSNCEYAPKKDTQSNDVNISLARVSTSSKTQPCTNLPINCKLCSSRGQIVPVWKYNFGAHVDLRHGGAQSGAAKGHEDFLKSVQVDDREAKAVKNLNKDTGRPKQTKRAQVDEGGEGSGRVASKRRKGHKGGVVQPGNGHVPSEQAGGDEVGGGAVFSREDAASERSI